ncbi:hypothetical protein V9T40_009074 [Parthenolecanium corni]|uniref:Uncharacterized protein n=1 Tax=Parthenolecanium corni TaxID=536013 RepID=A0AAN9TPA0_9HEMI
MIYDCGHSIKLGNLTTLVCSSLAGDKKRKIYDQYGKEGLINGGGRSGARSRSRHYPDGSDFDFMNNFSFPNFTFRDPDDVFKEFFGGSPFDIFELGNFSSRGSRNGHQTQVASVFNPFAGFGGFGMGNEFDDMFGTNGNSQFSTFTTSSSFGGVGNGGAVKKTSTSTRFSNGKKITTKKIIDGNKETVLRYENDVLTSKTVNGVPQALTYG